MVIGIASGKNKDSLKQFLKDLALEGQGATDCIKPRNNRKIKLEFDFEHYKNRHWINFQKLKRNR